MLQNGYRFVVAISKNIDYLNAHSNRWWSFPYTSNKLVLTPDGVIIHPYVHVPGTWHNGAVPTDLCRCLLNKTPEGYWIIGHTAFPKLQGRTYTTPKDGSLEFPDSPDDWAKLLCFTEELVSLRQSEEMQIRCRQGFFCRLKILMLGNNALYRQHIGSGCWSCAASY
ncbi:hypothetical protein FN846DRAFT_788518 [Sphaerosporella brunnea]|uniref:DDE Tnp4 domain-containing protein n=1 Tax=Sphaerosporella brunnea TaxID=1250544 RepID=A0A5J5EBT3_9PEZI|nr:hypothetical protein FN846DRAFT_788518 [Sphaerosporella brunnea]